MWRKRGSRKGNSGTQDTVNGLKKPRLQHAGSPLPSTSKAAMKQAREEENDEVSEEPTNETMDTIQLLSIFPKEIWTIILDLVSDSNDFANVCNSSIFFRDMLKSKRTRMLFPTVFEVLCKKLNGDHPKPEYKKDASCKSTYPRWERPKPLGPYNHKRVILNLRLVCRTWKMGVDQFYQNLTHLYEMNLRKGRLINKWHIDSFYQNRNYEIQNFLRHFDGTHSGNGDADDRSPFIGRAVSFCSKDIDMRRRFVGCGCCGGRIRAPLLPENAPERLFMAAITSLLLKYGHHVWHCTINVIHNYQTRREYFAKLREWLQLMPNLKVIRITYKEPSGTKLTRLELAVVDNPLFKLDHLEFVYTKNLPATIFQEFVGKNDHIRMLEVVNSIERPSLVYNLSVQSMTNLTQLSLKIYEETQLDYLKSSQEGWRLTRLHLDFEDCQQNIPWPRIFTTLETKWGDTLTNVMLILPTSELEENANQIMEECSQYKLNLPQVKYLKLKLCRYSTLDFILPMRDALEILDINVGFEFTRLWNTKYLRKQLENSQRIQFLGYFNRVLDSNIWTELTNLKQIDIMETNIDTSAGCLKWCHHTRQDWETEKVMKEGRAMRKVIKRINKN